MFSWQFKGFSGLIWLFNTLAQGRETARGVAAPRRGGGAAAARRAFSFLSRGSAAARRRARRLRGRNSCLHAVKTAIFIKKF